MTPVPVGTTTQVGIAGTIGAFVLAIIALATGHDPEALAATIASGAQLMTVLAGRYAQAHAAVKHPDPSWRADLGDTAGAHDHPQPAAAP